MGKRCISARAVGFFFRSGIVNCRIGSLESVTPAQATTVTVNCRIGSLERQFLCRAFPGFVNCRIGSLEIILTELQKTLLVNCRIGSLENTSV